MKLLYLTHMRLPTEKAYGVQMLNTCKAFAQNKVAVTMFVAKHVNEISKDVFSYYGVAPLLLHFYYFNVPTFFKNTRLGFWLHMLLFSVVCMARSRGKGFDIYYSREPFPLFFYTFLNKKTVYEMHDFPQTQLWFHRWLCRRVSYVVVTNAWAKEKCKEVFGIKESNLILAPNGFDGELYKEHISKLDARTQLMMPLQQKIVLYSGHLYAWKGVETILEVAKNLPDIQFIFVGGLPADQKRLQDNYSNSNVQFVPHQSPHLVPVYLMAADVLVLPNVPLTQHSEFSTSPIKLFEYMAARRPVIASRLPAITSLVNEEEVFFATAGDAQDWQTQILFVVNTPSSVQVRVDAALNKAQLFTWQAKAQTILQRVIL